MYLVDPVVAVISWVSLVCLFPALQFFMFQMKVCGEVAGEGRSSWDIRLLSETWLGAEGSEIRDLISKDMDDFSVENNIDSQLSILAK